MYMCGSLSHDILLCVHDKRPLSDDRLVDRLPQEGENLGGLAFPLASMMTKLVPPFP